MRIMFSLALSVHGTLPIRCYLSCPLSRAFLYPQPGNAGGRHSGPAVCQSLTSADSTHAHTIATCFAVVLILCHLILDSLSTLYLEFYLLASHYTAQPSNHSRLCLLKCHLIFLSYRPDLTSKQYTTSHTTAIHSHSHFQ